MSENRIIPLKYNLDYEVIQSNQLIRLKQTNMSMMETKILRVCIAQILKKDAEFLTYTCKAPELASLMNIPASEVYEAFKKMAKTLLQRVIYVPIGKNKRGQENYEMFQWVSCAKYEDGLFSIRLHDNLKPYLLELNGMFTDYTLSEIMQLPSTYAIRLYELLRSVSALTVRKSYKNVSNIPIENNEVIFSIEYLRHVFDCENKYKNTGDFAKRVIVSSVDAINAKTIMRLNYRMATKGRKITHVIFAFVRQL